MSSTKKANWYIHIVPNGSGFDLVHSCLDTIDHGGGQQLNRTPLTEAEADEKAEMLNNDETEVIKHDRPARTHAEWLAGEPATH